VTIEQRISRLICPHRFCGGQLKRPYTKSAFKTCVCDKCGVVVLAWVAI